MNGAKAVKLLGDMMVVNLILLWASFLGSDRHVTDMRSLCSPNIRRDDRCRGRQ